MQGGNVDDHGQDQHHADPGDQRPFQAQPPVASRQPELARLLPQKQQDRDQRDPQAQARVDEPVGLQRLGVLVRVKQVRRDGRPDQEGRPSGRAVSPVPARLVAVRAGLRPSCLGCHTPT